MATDPSRVPVLVSGSLALLVSLVLLACAPGIDDDLAARLGGLSFLPDWLRWGYADAVMLPKLAVLLTLGPLTVGACLALGFARPRPRPRLADPTLAVLLLLLMACVLLSAWSSIFPPLSWEPAWGIAACIALCVAAGFGLARPEIAAAMRAVVAAGGLVAVYALGQHAGLDLFAWTPPELVRERSIATLANPNFLAATLIGLIPLGVMAWTGSTGWRRVAWAAVTALLLVATVFTYTRGTWLAMIAQLVLLAAMRQRAPLDRSLAGFTLIAALASAFVLSTPAPRHISLGERALRTVVPTDESSSARLALWKEAVHVAADRPLLGTGPGTFSYAAMPFRAYESSKLLARRALPNDPHNQFLDLLSASGAFAFVLFLAALGRGGMRAARDPDPVAPFVATALLGWAVAHAFVQATPPGWLILGLLLAWVMARTEAPSDSPGRAVAPECALILALALAVSVSVGRDMARTLDADLRLNLANSLAAQAFASKDTVEGGRYLNAALGRLEEGLAAASGTRKGAMARHKARMLATLYGRSTPALRESDRVFWNRVRDDALASYRLAVETNPLDPYSWMELARFLMQLSMQAGAEAERAQLGDLALGASRAAVTRDPFNAALLADHADILGRTGHAKEAEAAFQRSLALAPEQLYARLDYAGFLQREGRKADALRILEEAVRQYPGSTQAESALRAVRKTP